MHAVSRTEAKHAATRPVRNFVVEFFNHPAAKGDTVFCGTKQGVSKFLEHESNTLLTPAMQRRADEFLWYIKSLTMTDLKACDGFYWPLESGNDAGAYYYLSLHRGRHAKRFADV